MNRINQIIWRMGLLMALAGCSSGPVEVDWERQGRVRVAVDRRIASEAGSMNYYFYPEGEDVPLIRRGDAEGFEGVLPAGVYRLLVCKYDEKHLTLVTEQGYEALAAVSRLAAMRQSAGNVRYIEQPAYLYVAIEEQVKIDPGDRVNVIQVRPADWVKQVTLRIALEESVGEVKQIYGELTGIASEVSLSQQTLSYERASAVVFPVVQKGRGYEASVRLLGVKAEAGLEHEAGLWLTFVADDGERTTTWTNLTETFHVAFEQKEEDEVTVDVEVSPDETGGLASDVTDWKQGGGNAT